MNGIDILANLFCGVLVVVFSALAISPLWLFGEWIATVVWEIKGSRK